MSHLRTPNSVPGIPARPASSDAVNHARTDPPSPRGFGWAGGHGPAALQDVWGGDVIVAYSEIGTLASSGTPSYGYTYRLRNHPVVREPRWDHDTQSWLYPVFDEVSPVMAGPDAGFLIQNAVSFAPAPEE